MLFFYFYLVTGCDERSKLGTFIQVRIKDRMAEIETDDIGELHEKVSVSLNESGIGPDSSGAFIVVIGFFDNTIFTEFCIFSKIP
jgi:hypothetical protein